VLADHPRLAPTGAHALRARIAFAPRKMVIGV
jgi:hypothetical protein